MGASILEDGDADVTFVRADVLSGRERGDINSRAIKGFHVKLGLVYFPHADIFARQVLLIQFQLLSPPLLLERRPNLKEIRITRRCHLLINRILLNLNQNLLRTLLLHPLLRDLINLLDPLRHHLLHHRLIPLLHLTISMRLLELPNRPHLPLLRKHPVGPFLLRHVYPDVAHDMLVPCAFFVLNTGQV